MVPPSFEWLYSFKSNLRRTTVFWTIISIHFFHIGTKTTTDNNCLKRYVTQAATKTQPRQLEPLYATTSLNTLSSVDILDQAHCLCTLNKMRSLAAPPPAISRLWRAVSFQPLQPIPCGCSSMCLDPAPEFLPFFNGTIRSCKLILQLLILAC